MKKSFYFLLILLSGLSACKLVSVSFTAPGNANDRFFSSVLQQAKKRIRLDDIAQITGPVDIYRVRFREQQVEESGVLERRMISEHDPRFIHRDVDFTAGQDIYLYRLYSTNQVQDVFVYFSISVDSGGVRTGAGAAYLGILNLSDTIRKIPQISFYERLDFVQCDDGPRLIPDKKSDKREFAEDILRFTLSQSIERGKDSLNVDKIILLENNKTGGKNPVLYPVTSMLGENAMLMKKQPVTR